MKMQKARTTVIISGEDALFLKQNPQFNASGLLAWAIQEHRTAMDEVRKRKYNPF
jgi:hypothetical protein